MKSKKPKDPKQYNIYTYEIGVKEYIIKVLTSAINDKNAPEHYPNMLKFVKNEIESFHVEIPERSIINGYDSFVYGYKYKNEERREENEKELFTFLNVIQGLGDIIRDYLKEYPKKQDKSLTQMGLHAVRQFYGGSKQLNIFSDERINEFCKATGLNIKDRPNSYGAVLNVSQKRVYEGILKAFSDSNYLGHEQKEKKEILEKIYSPSSSSVNLISKGENAVYKNIDKIPVVRLTQAEIIALSGYDLKAQRQGDKQDVIEAIDFLATKQFCFYWLRLKKENGEPVKDKNGNYIKEEVMEVSSFFRVKYVRDEEGKNISYYEIHPSAVLLDQVNDYFLLVPSNWRDEVKELTGKRASSYTYEFLFWLRVQYEQIRAFNSNGGKRRKPKTFKISKSWEEIAIALKMPESMYKRNRQRALNIIKEAYSVAYKLGYLKRVENNGVNDVLYLNESYYPKPGELV